MTKRFEDYTSLSDALATLRSSTRVVLTRERVSLGSAAGRVLSEDVRSRYDVPFMDSAHMDGFAVRSSDLEGASVGNPVPLRLVKGSPLGVVPRKRVVKGQAQTVLTGGFMPPGADAVVQVEHTRASGDDVIFTSTPAPGDFVYRAGSDIRKGEVVIARGRLLRGSDLVLLGSLHAARVPVYRRPKVAILPTGNELTEEVEDSRPGRVVETHSYLLSRLIRGAGGVPLVMPIARDEKEEVARSIRAAIRGADIVLTLAGSSVGEADLTEGAINSLGKPGILVHGMRVHRGRVMGFGVVRGKAVVMLPGPIQGAVNAFALMAYPLIRSFIGRGFEEPPSVPAALTNSWDAGERYRDFTKVVYVKLETGGSEIMVETGVGETEKATFIARSDGYIVVDEATRSLAAGDRVRAHLLSGLSPL